MLQLLKSNKGGSIVELLVVLGIIVAALGAILGFAAFSLLSSDRVQRTQEAVVLASEMLEIMRNYRDGIPWNEDNAGYEYDGLGVLDFDLQPFYIEKSADVPPRWRLVSGTETVGMFDRKIYLEKLERDANDDIGPGTLDPESIEVLAVVSWQERGKSHEVRIVEYLTNWQQL